MENLWPDDLLEGRGKHAPNEIELVLAAQAEGISERTRGLVTGLVQDRSVAPGRAWALQLYPSQQPAKKTDLFVVRTEAGGYPATIESFDPDQTRWKKVSGLSAFRVALKEIFLASQTKRIVRLLFQEAKDAGLEEMELPLKQSNQEARPLLLGKVIQEGALEFCHVMLLGIAGFIDAREIRKLLLKPDARSSPIEMLNDRYVVTLKFLDSVKMTLSKDELQVLQAEVRRAIEPESGQIRTD